MDIEGTTPNSPDDDRTSDDRISMDPVHPGPIHSARPAQPAPAHGATGRPAPRRRAKIDNTGPEAAELGFPAVLEHELVAVGINSSATPVTIHGWADGKAEETALSPVNAHIWARAGRVTLVDSEGRMHRLTLLSKEEYAGHRVGEHWPTGEPANRTKRVASAALHDLGDVLTFPVWLARTAHTSGARNAAMSEFVRKLAAASPATNVHRNQTFGTPTTQPDHLHPYDHRGLMGHEGYPREL